MDEATRRMFDEHEASGLLPRLRLRAMSFCAPIWWERGGQTVLHNGSMCVIATSDAVFGVTNNHVLLAYEEDMAEQADVFCQLGSGPFDPVANLICRSECWDLATFRIPDLTLQHWGHRVWVARDWPPAPIKRGDAIILGGYPGIRRATAPGPKPETMSQDYVSFLGRADNWSESHMSFCFDSSSWYWPQGTALEPHPELGGASGGPCFRLIGEEERIELAGFIYQAQPDYEVIRVRQASLISADGTIAPTPPGTLQRRA